MYDGLIVSAERIDQVSRAHFRAFRKRDAEESRALPRCVTDDIAEMEAQTAEALRIYGPYVP
eukprot:3526413-Alexandrium_andersonii.AAC.1